MATATPIRVQAIPSLVDNPLAMQELRDGMGNAVAELGIVALVAALRGADNHPGVFDFERSVVDAAIAEIAPAVADMLTAAIERRLPWTWEPER
jgi:hypothetical protein